MLSRVAENIHSNRYFRESEGCFKNGPFSTVSFRGPARPRGSSNRLIVLEVKEDVRLVPEDLRDSFEFSMEAVEVNPKIPHEGIVPFREVHGMRTLFMEFTARSWMLRTIVVPENP